MARKAKAAKPAKAKVTTEKRTVTLKNGHKRVETVQKVNGVTVYTGGDRGAPPIQKSTKVVGSVLRSTVLRIDADLAAAIRAEARDSEMNITAVTRRIYREMYGK